jgi:hypothetical protein
VSTSTQDPSRHAGFADIEFGFADAEKESAQNPDLLLFAFFDDSHIVDKALKGSPFLLLGYKGSGKTAIAERANLLASSDPSLFVKVEQLADFSYTDFKLGFRTFGGWSALAGGGGDPRR